MATHSCEILTPSSHTESWSHITMVIHQKKVCASRKTLKPDTYLYQKTTTMLFGTNISSWCMRALDIATNHRQLILKRSKCKKTFKSLRLKRILLGLNDSEQFGQTSPQSCLIHTNQPMPCTCCSTAPDCGLQCVHGEKNYIDLIHIAGPLDIWSLAGSAWVWSSERCCGSF